MEDRRDEHAAEHHQPATASPRCAYEPPSVEFIPLHTEEQLMQCLKVDVWDCSPFPAGS